MSKGREKVQIPRILGNWMLEDCLGSGYSGYIYRARQIHTGQMVALKIQRSDHECPTNRYERYIYPLLRGVRGVPQLFATAVNGPWDWLAIDLLGPSLDSLFRKSGRDTMDLRSVCAIAMQLISRMESMHNSGVLHRDIQLANCTIGLPPNDRLIYMIDFGFAKQYIDPKTHRHIPDSRAKRDFIGNYWFSSVAVHCRGRVPSRRDDLEALALMLIHLLTPKGLSWTRNGIPKTEVAHSTLKLEKMNASPEDLCRGLPEEFEEFLRYCRRLKFQETPDYKHWREQFRLLALDCGFPDSDEFIWPPPPLPAPLPQRLIQSPRKLRAAAPEPEDLKQVLKGLAELKFSGKGVLGDRSNIDSIIRQVREERSLNSKLTAPDSEGGSRNTAARGTDKAARLAKLVSQVPAACTNKQLASLVHEFTQTLQLNTSKTLTKDAIRFLEVLKKQLEDPSIFIVAEKSSKKRSGSAKEDDDAQTSGYKLNVVHQLRFRVKKAGSNRELADMVTEFIKVTNKSGGKTVTKDGFLFLEGLAVRLGYLGPTA
ncbi:hypothetical protein AX16_005378 [Volvariella volvacea WC 439]|nr:hypothetical protein AX16_005378 [Volvariella volvacea WC 439]